MRQIPTDATDSRRSKELVGGELGIVVDWFDFGSDCAVLFA